MVKVYSFSKYQIISDKKIISPRKETLEFINKARGEPIMSSEEDVDASELDAEGRYDPR